MSQDDGDDYDNVDGDNDNDDNYDNSDDDDSDDDIPLRHFCALAFYTLVASYPCVCVRTLLCSPWWPRTYDPPSCISL